MNLTDMRTIVRRDLHDEDASNYRWTNDELSVTATYEICRHDIGEACSRQIEI